MTDFAVSMRKMEWPKISGFGPSRKPHVANGYVLTTVAFMYPGTLFKLKILFPALRVNMNLRIKNV